MLTSDRAALKTEYCEAKGISSALFRKSLIYQWSVAPDVKYVHLAVVQAGDRFELPDALELALIRALMFKAVAIDNLHRAEFTEDIPCQPYFAVAAAADLADGLMVWNPQGRWVRDWSRNRMASS